MEYLLHAVLLRRYSILSEGVPTPPVNVVEKAVDLSLEAVNQLIEQSKEQCHFVPRG